MKCQLCVASEQITKPMQTIRQPQAATFRGLKLLIAGPMNRPEKFKAKLLRFVISAVVNVVACIRSSSPPNNCPYTDRID